MEVTSNSEPKCSYSWWWDSHITPKNSKWLLDNLTDMDSKIKAMIKLIEEDADSFARRAEMYYKKRPDLMKLVEEFYRAYRALAERYDYVTGALRQAHSTITMAFPDQIQTMLPDEPPSGLLDAGDEHTYESNMQMESNPIQWDADSLDKIASFLSKEGMKSLNCLFTDEDTQKKFSKKLLNKSLNLKEIDSKKLEEEVSELSKENTNLKNEIMSESQRADNAVAELQCLNNDISKLRSEIESAFLQYKFFEERISNLESEISGHEREKTSQQVELDELNLIVSKQQEEASELLKQNQNLHHQVDSESKRADRAEDHCLLVQEENKSLQYALDKFMKKAASYEEEITMREEELKKLEQYVEFERQHNVQAEMTEKSLRTQLYKLEQKVEMQEEEIAIREYELNELKQHVEDGQKHQALVELHSQSQEKMRSLNLEIQHGAEKLRKMELREAGLEEEMMRLRDENKCLSEQNFSSVSKIICLQDEIISLKALKNKIHDEARFNAEEKIFLQRELSSYKSKSNDLELREAVYEEEMGRLHDENIGLYENFFSLSSEIINLQDEILYLRESKYRLEDELQFHVDEKKALRHEIFSLKNEKNGLEERHHELTEHIEEVNCNVISLQEVVKDLHDGNKELRDTCKKHEEEKACHLKQFMLMRSMADKNAQLDNSFSSVSAELKILFEKINGLEEYRESVYSNVHGHISSEPVLVSHIETVTQKKHSVLEDSISDLNVEFDVLSGKVKALEEPCQSLYCQKVHLITDSNNLASQVERVGLHLQSLENRFVILEGKQVNIEEKDLSLCHIQKFSGKEEHYDDHIYFFRNQLSVLSKQIHLLKKENQVTKEELEEEHLRTVASEVKNFILKQFLVDLNETNLFLSKECQKYMEKLEFAENFILELKKEWASQEMNLVTIADRKEKLLEGIRVMMKICDTKKAFEISNDSDDDILRKISELQGAISAAKSDIHHFQLEEKSSFRLKSKKLHEVSHASQTEISKLLEENEISSKKLHERSDQNDAWEEENEAILEESRTQEHPSLFFKNCHTDKSSDIEWLIRDVNCLYRITNDLGQGIRVINKSIRAIEDSENKTHRARNASRKLDMEAETKKKLLESNSSSEGSTLTMELGELEEETSCKDHEIGCLQESNKLLEVEVHKLHNLVEELATKEKNLENELHVSSFMELIFKEKLFELMRMREVDIVQLKIPVEETVQEEELKEKFDVLGRENKGLKAELNAFAPLVVSLEKEITSLEEHILSLTNIHILNSKRKQGSILAALHHKKCSQARGKHQSPRASGGNLELKKLRAKVKVLQKEVTDAEGSAEHGKIVSGTNETKKNKTFKLTGTQKKKDVKLSKDGVVKHEQMMKDIELDHVLSGSQRESDFNVGTDERTLVVWEPATWSSNPSSELVLEKELRVDNLIVPVKYNESLQEWIDRVSGSLSADSRRLLALEKSLEELKMKIKCPEHNAVKLLLKEAEESLIKLTDFNFKLTKVAETFSQSSDSHKIRRKVLERVQRGAEKIDGVELKLQKVHSILLKLQDEKLEIKAAIPLEKRSRLPLKDLIYGKRSDPKQMKRRFCACMRFKTKEN